MLKGTHQDLLKFLLKKTFLTKFTYTFNINFISLSDASNRKKERKTHYFSYLYHLLLYKLLMQFAQCALNTDDGYKQVYFKGKPIWKIIQVILI